MEELTMLLNNISDTYYDFVVTVLAYSKKKKERQDAVTNFIKENPECSTSDVLAFVMEQDDVFEDAAYHVAKVS